MTHLVCKQFVIAGDCGIIWTIINTIFKIWVVCPFAWFILSAALWGDGLAQLVEHQTRDSMTRGSNPARSTRKTCEFFLVKNVVLTHCQCAQHPVVHVRVWWIMETCTDPACSEKWQNNQPVDCGHSMEEEEEENNYTFRTVQALDIYLSDCRKYLEWGMSDVNPTENSWF